MVNCKSCGSKVVVKNGWVRGKQRYRCKDCGFNFVDGDKRIKQSTSVKKALAVILCSLGKASFNMLGKIFGHSPSGGSIKKTAKSAEVSFQKHFCNFIVWSRKCNGFPLSEIRGTENPSENGFLGWGKSTVWRWWFSVTRQIKLHDSSHIILP